LSYTINQVLTRAQTPLTYRELAQRVHDQYTRWERHFPTPLLEGTHLDREVLGQKDWQGRSLIRLSRGASGYTINAGALHGLTKGSILEVRPPAGDPEADKIAGHVRVRRIQPLQSSVEPCAYADVEINETLPDGGDCRLVYQDYGEIRLRMAVDPSDIDGRPSPASSVARLTAVLKQLASQKGSFVELVDPDAEVDWLARIGGGRVYLVPAGGWAVPRGADAADAAPPMFGPAPLGDLADWLDARLRRIARVHNLLKLDAGESGVVMRPRGSVDVDVDLLRYASEDATEFEVVPWDNGRTLRAGDIVQFRVTNKGLEPVDVTLLFVDSEYGITAYFPQIGFVENNRVDPTKQFLSPRAEVTPTDGPEHMVVIAVRAELQREPMNFSFLEQPSIERARGTPRTTPSLDSPLGKLLQSAMFAEGATRGLSRASIDKHAVRRLTWSVVEAED
jgi:hypothetical protein